MFSITFYVFRQCMFFIISGRVTFTNFQSIDATDYFDFQTNQEGQKLSLDFHFYENIFVISFMTKAFYTQVLSFFSLKIFLVLQDKISSTYTIHTVYMYCSIVLNNIK